METFASEDEALDFAIANEEAAHAFYSELAGKMEEPGMASLFEQFAREELGHKEKLVRVKEGKSMMGKAAKIMDLKIGDYLVDVEPSKDMDYQAALILAMKKEKKAFMLYTELAESVDEENLQNLFVSLAQEEAGHKLRLEMIYDDEILTEN